VALRRLLLTLTLLAAASPATHAQLSPGELSRFHAHLEGARNCASCHAAGRGVTPQLCLICHAALGQRIAGGRGLHARPDHRACERCHVEHQGRDFDLVFWGKQGKGAFDHASVGFSLQGRHARVACESCHRASRLRDSATLSRGGANLARTFLGLGTACASCHTDPHRGQFAPRGCATCHGQEQWAPATAFDHDRAGFALSGAHRTVACAGCHKPHPSGSVRFEGTPHASCASCHRDPHEGRLGGQCDSCHVSEAWNRVAAGQFDHTRTRFPLTGRHAAVACARCHPNRPPGGMKLEGIAFQSCASCHRDPHAARLGAQCAACHTPASWGRIAPGRFDHERTGYPLRGKHTAVPCDACHKDGARRRIAHARCTDCHADRHVGQLAARPDGGLCESCHDVDGFTPARFSAADHTATRHPLTGAHLAVPCDACHAEVPVERLAALGFAKARPGPQRTEQLRFAGTGCSDCHRDPHRGQLARFGACRQCHATEAWMALAAFDHSRTGFPLAGQHARIPCRSCHPGEKGALAFAGRPTACVACHRDPHGGRFARGGGTDCARCHKPTSWGAFQFDHDRETSFPLQGAHRSVPCAACHRVETPAGPILRYSGLGKACSDCHGPPRGPRSGGPS
jgi:hypothetical protein